MTQPGLGYEIQPASPISRVTRGQWLTLAVILCVGLAARLWNIGGESFWADEFMSAQVSAGHGYQAMDLPRGRLLPPPSDSFAISSAGDWGAFYRSMDRSTHPPLYFVLLRLWRQCIGGDSDALLRALSSIFSVICIALAFDAVRLLQRSTGAALWVAATLAVANGQVQFGQEARGYALLCTFMLGCCAAIVRIERLGFNQKRIVALVCCALGMMMTHYLGFAIAGLLAVYSMVRLPKTPLRAILWALMGAAAVVGLCWGPSMITQARSVHMHLSWMTEPREGHLWNTLDRIAQLPIHFVANPGWNPDPICYGVAILYAIPLLFLRRRPELLLWTLLFIGEVCVIAVGDLWRSSTALTYQRYTLPGATAAVILLPLMLQAGVTGRWLKQLAPAGLILGCLAALPLSYNRDKPDWRALAQYVDRYCNDDSPLVFFPNQEGEWYAALLQTGVSRYLANRTHPIEVLNGPITDQEMDLPSGKPMEIISGSLPPEKILPGCVVMQQSYFPMIGAVSRVVMPNSVKTLSRLKLAASPARVAEVSD